MEEGLFALGGIVVGAFLGGMGRYWALRRDAWKEARAAGLLLLSDVILVRKAEPSDWIVSETALGVKTWETHREVLAGFRRGTFPHGLKAPEWLELADHFAELSKLFTTHAYSTDGRWSDDAWEKLACAERLLKRFGHDPIVLLYVITYPIRWLWAQVEGSP